MSFWIDRVINGKFSPLESRINEMSNFTGNLLDGWENGVGIEPKQYNFSSKIDTIYRASVSAGLDMTKYSASENSGDKAINLREMRVSIPKLREAVDQLGEYSDKGDTGGMEDNKSLRFITAVVKENMNLIEKEFNRRQKTFKEDINSSAARSPN